MNAYAFSPFLELTKWFRSLKGRRSCIFFSSLYLSLADIHRYFELERICQTYDGILFSEGDDDLAPIAAEIRRLRRQVEELSPKNDDPTLEDNAVFVGELREFYRNDAAADTSFVPPRVEDDGAEWCEEDERGTSSSLQKLDALRHLHVAAGKDIRHCSPRGPSKAVQVVEFGLSYVVPKRKHVIYERGTDNSLTGTGWSVSLGRGVNELRRDVHRAATRCSPSCDEEMFN